MLRGEDIICGTSTTGTGTLTLAACPAPPGGTDFYAWLTSSGFGFVNGNAVLVSYIIKEFTDSTFATVIRSEEGVGTLTLGASLTACTLARTTVQATQTAESTTGVYLGNAPSAITIGTAANVLVFIGPKAADIPAYCPYYETSNGDNLGVNPLICSDAVGLGVNLVTAVDWYVPFFWSSPMLVKKGSVRVSLAYATGSPVSNAYLRIYAFNTSGRPGKLLLDLGLLGSANTSLNSAALVSTAVHSTGFFLAPGEYIMNMIAILSGGSTAPKMRTVGVNATTVGTMIRSSRFGTLAGLPYLNASATGGNGATPADPANVTSYTAGTNLQNNFLFMLSPS